MKSYKLISVFLFLCACQKYEVSVSQHLVNRDYLASTHAGTPDPRQACPPMGQMLAASWVVPTDLLQQDPYLQLHVIYKNYTEEIFTYPIETKRGYITYFLTNDEFFEKKGILTYKAEIITENGEVYREWKHQLWVNLIKLDEVESSSSPQDSNSSVVDQPMQGSVMETP